MKFFNADAEMSLIGGLLISGGELLDSIGSLDESDFFDGRLKTIYGAIKRLASSGAPTTDIDVIHCLGDDIDDAGGLEFIVSLSAMYPSKSRISRWADIIRQLSASRKLISAISESQEIAQDDGDISDKLGRIHAILAPLAQGQVKRMPRKIYDIALSRTHFYEDVQMGRVQPGWPVGLPSLDRALTGGFRPGKFYLIGARPSVGKSSFSAQILIELATRGIPGLMFSQEMPAEEVADRAVASGGVDYGDIQRGELSDSGWGNVVSRLEELKHLPIWIDDQPALTLADIRNKISLCPGVRAIVLDYLQLCSKSTGTSAANRNSEIEEISRGLKNLSKELDIAVIVLSQLNREVEKRVNKRPILSDLRDSGSLEQDADVVLFLWPVKEVEGGRIVGLGVDKNRQGTKPEIALHFNGAHQKWHESTESLYQPQPQQSVTRGFK